MKIEIEYKGSYAVCKVDGKYFQQCDSLTKAMVFSAFSCIEQDFRRNNNKYYEYDKTNPR